MKGEAAVAILASEGLAQVAVSCLAFLRICWEQKTILY